MSNARAAAKNLGGDKSGARSSRRARSTDDQTATELYQPTRQTLESAGLDQEAAEEERQTELAEERRVHNVRTGNPSAPEGFKY